MTTAPGSAQAQGPAPEAPMLGIPAMPAPDYPADVRDRLEPDAREIIARYPDSRSALLPLLHLVQAEEGYVTRTGQRFCAEMLELAGEYGTHWPERRNANLDRRHAQNDRTASHDDRVALTEGARRTRSVKTPRSHNTR